MKNYYCSKCGTLLQTEKDPRSQGCPAGGTHQWRDLGEVGPLNYQCVQCGLLLKSAKDPRSGVTCKATGKPHQWNKL